VKLLLQLEQLFARERSSTSSGFSSSSVLAAVRQARFGGDVASVAVLAVVAAVTELVVVAAERFGGVDVVWSGKNCNKLTLGFLNVNMLILY
jgi:hypothetical protein